MNNPGRIDVDGRGGRFSSVTRKIEAEVLFPPLNAIPLIPGLPILLFPWVRKRVIRRVELSLETDQECRPGRRPARQATVELSLETDQEVARKTGFLSAVQSCRTEGFG